MNKTMLVNKVIKILISADFALNTSFGLLAPMFAIFITKQIQGGNVEVVGFATAVYWITKSIFQLPISKWLDKDHGEKDDFYALVGGNLFASIAIFLYIFAETPLHIYLIEAMLGISMAFFVPAWYGIFIRHIDKFHESFEWSLESVFSIGIATALSGAMSGIIVTKFGFNILFILASLLSFVSAIAFILLYPYLLPKDHIQAKTPPFDKKAF